MRDRHRYLFRNLLRVRLSSLGLLAVLLSWPGTAMAQVSKDDLMGPVPPAECRANGEDRTPVLIVGSYHMSNPGADRFNLESDDVLSARRQQEIEDVVSEVFIKAYRSLHRYRPDHPFSTWLYRIVVNLCLNELRWRKGKKAVALAVSTETSSRSTAASP